MICLFVAGVGCFNFGYIIFFARLRKLQPGYLFKPRAYQTDWKPPC